MIHLCIRGVLSAAPGCRGRRLLAKAERKRRVETPRAHEYRVDMQREAMLNGEETERRVLDRERGARVVPLIVMACTGVAWPLTMRRARLRGGGRSTAAGSGTRSGRPSGRRAAGASWPPPPPLRRPSCSPCPCRRDCTLRSVRPGTAPLQETSISLIVLPLAICPSSIASRSP